MKGLGFVQRNVGIAFKELGFLLNALHFKKRLNDEKIYKN
jgi:hypothetical protein